jgi:methylase of polypeptide subunit release factors
MEGAPHHIAPGGWLALEVDESHARQVARELEDAGWTRPQVFEDLTGRPRVVLARYGE